MKKLNLLVCLLLTLFMFTSCLESGSKQTEIRLVTADEMESILQVEDVQLVDVRSPEEFEEIHLTNAQNIDFNSPTFDDDITRLDKEKPVILYCKGGITSAKCAKKLKDAGFKKIYDLEGGLSKWQHSNRIRVEVKS